MGDLAAGFDALIGRDGGPIVWWQMGVRAALVMLFGLVLVRVGGKRVFGEWGAMDIIVSIIIGSNLSRAITGNSPFLATLFASTALVALHGGLAALAVRWPALGPVLKGRPVRIVRDSEPDHAAMRRHGLGQHDLEEALRAAGVTDCGPVREAWLERNGDITVVKRS